MWYFLYHHSAVYLSHSHAHSYSPHFRNLAHHLTPILGLVLAECRGNTALFAAIANRDDAMWEVIIHTHTHIYIYIMLLRLEIRFGFQVQ